MTFRTLEEATAALLKQYNVKTEAELFSTLGSDKANKALGSIAPNGTGFAITQPVSTDLSPTSTNRYGNVSLQNTPDLQLEQANAYKRLNDYKGQDGYNPITGNADVLSMDGAFGTEFSTGYTKPALQLGQGLFNGYMAYQGLQETKKNNDRNYKLAKENERRSAIAYNNKVNEKKRYAGLLTGNSNSYSATVGTIAANPYSRY